MSVSAAAFWMILAVSTWPVKAILSTSGCTTRAAPVVSPMPLTRLMTPAGKPASMASSPMRRRGQRRLLGGLHDDGVAARQGRAPLPGQHQQREVPRDDLADDADRLPQRVGQEVAAHRHGPALDLVGPAGVVAERVDDALHVAARIGDGLAAVERFHRRQFLRVLLDEVGELEHAAGRGRRRPSSPTGRISSASRAALTALSTSLRRRRRHLGDHLAGRRVVRCRRCRPRPGSTHSLLMSSFVCLIAGTAGRFVIVAVMFSSLEREVRSVMFGRE